MRMAPPHYLKIFRRRWRVILACFLIATAVGYILSPEKPAAPKGTGYQASVTLVSAPEVSPPPNLYIAAHLATSPDIAASAAEQLPAEVRPRDDTSITASADPDAGAVTITAIDLDEDSAVALAQAYGEETVQFVSAAAARSREAALEAARKELKASENNLEDLREERPFDPLAPVDPVLQAKIDSEIARYTAVRQRVEDLVRAEAGPAPLQVVGTAQVEPLEGGVISAPDDRGVRALLAGVLGLVLGLGVALAVDRLDNRLRERGEVEDAFGLPVLGEIPRISRRKRARHALVTTARPDSPAAEAYRSLRSAITLVSHTTRVDGGAASAPDSRQSQQAQVLIVTAAHGGEGKSTAVANLAVAFAETGRTVIVIDCDFRKPDAHRFLGVSAGPTGTTNAGFDGDFDQITRHTAVSHVRLITTRTPVGQPASVLPRLAEVVAEAREHADVVLIDSSPLLVVSEAVDVLQYADAALIACRIGRTTREQAQRARLVLERAEIPVLGVVVTGTAPTRGTPYGRPSRSHAIRTSLTTWAAQAAAPSRSATTVAETGRTTDETSADISEYVPHHPQDEPQEQRPQQGTADQQRGDQPAQGEEAYVRRYQRRHERPDQSHDTWNVAADKRPDEVQYDRWHESGPAPKKDEAESADERPEAWEEEPLRSAG